MTFKRKLAIVLGSTVAIVAVVASVWLYRVNQKNRWLDRFTEAYTQLSLAAENLASAEAELEIAKAEKAFRDASPDKKDEACKALLAARKMQEPEEIRKKVLEKHISEKAKEWADLAL